MRKIFGFLLGLSLVTPAWADDSLWKEWTGATYKQRLAVHQLLWKSYPELPQSLYTDLKGHYPQLELKAFKAVLGFRQNHAGLPPQVARTLLQDLQGEPAEAALDVASAVLARYPDFPARFQELRKSVDGPGNLIASSGIRTAVLEQLSKDPSPPWGQVLNAVRSKHRGLGIRVFLDISRVMDKHPGLAGELAEARQDGLRPVHWLAMHHPDFLLEAARRVHEDYGTELRAAAQDALAELEQIQKSNPPVVAQTIYNVLEKSYPELAAQVVQKRLQARLELGRKLREAFPELPEIVAKTLQDKHPQLLGRAAASLDSHYPGLRQELLTALERELPGLDQEVHSFISGRYPDLKSQVDSLLKG